MFDCVLIHYGEIALKGLNRPFYERKLVENIKRALEGEEYAGVKHIHGRLILELSEKSDTSRIEERLKRVFGIAWFAFCYRTKADKESIMRCVEKNIPFNPGEKVRVSTNRADKTLPFTSIELNRELGAHLVNRFNVEGIAEGP
jgi:thiamine biosynthesis protein ThiI